MVTRSLKFPPSLLQGPNCTTSMSKVTVEPEVTAGNWFVISFPFTNTAPETISRSDNISHFLYILTCKTTSLYFLQANREVTLVHLGTGCNNCEQEEICDLTKDFYLHIHESCSCVQQGSEELGAVGLGKECCGSDSPLVLMHTALSRCSESSPFRCSTHTPRLSRRSGCPTVSILTRRKFS